MTLYRNIIISVITNIKAELYWAYFRIKGIQELSINGSVAYFSPERARGGKVNILRYLYEKEEITDLLSELRTDDIFYGIGANTGLYTCFAVQKLDDGAVLAFEPYPPNIDQLNENMRMNPGNVQIFNIALSNSPEEVELQVPTTDTIGYGEGSIVGESTTETISVRTERGDDLVKSGEIVEPDIMKIDVEGAEDYVIEGLEGTLSQGSCRIVYTEVHLNNNPRESSEITKEMHDKFQSMGYTTKELNRDESRCLIKAIIQS